MALSQLVNVRGEQQRQDNGNNDNGFSRRLYRLHRVQNNNIFVF